MMEGVDARFQIFLSWLHSVEVSQSVFVKFTILDLKLIVPFTLWWTFYSVVFFGCISILSIENDGWDALFDISHTLRNFFSILKRPHPINHLNEGQFRSLPHLWTLIDFNVIDKCLHYSYYIIECILYLTQLALNLFDKYCIVNPHWSHALHLALHRHALFSLLDCPRLHSLHLSLPPPDFILSFAYVLLLLPQALCLFLQQPLCLPFKVLHSS